VSATALLATIAVVWLLIGLALSLGMGRRGHESFGWLVLGTVLGPLAVLLAAAAVRDEHHATDRVLDPGASGGGPVDVVVGVDGSPESRAAALAVVSLLNGRLGRLTLASVIPYDGGRETERAALAELEARADALRGTRPGVELLHGRPADTLSRFAVENGYDLLAVGTRGVGLSKALLGSVAHTLASAAMVPVLLVGDGSGR
jgi:nucleotide-binding universal stress UspA family protein